MAGKGGARPGAGRKPKRDKNVTALNKAEGRIRDRLPELIDNLFRLADGVSVQETDARGAVKVYTRPPDFKACAYLIDRIMGKPTARQEIGGTGDDRPPISIIEVVKPFSEMSDAELQAIVDGKV